MTQIIYVTEIRPSKPEVLASGGTLTGWELGPGARPGTPATPIGWTRESTSRADLLLVCSRRKEIPNFPLDRSLYQLVYTFY
jgi:hypothetical protein